MKEFVLTEEKADILKSLLEDLTRANYAIKRGKKFPLSHTLFYGVKKALLEFAETLGIVNVVGYETQPNGLKTDKLVCIEVMGQEYHQQMNEIWAKYNPEYLREYHRRPYIYSIGPEQISEVSVDQIRKKVIELDIFDYVAGKNWKNIVRLMYPGISFKTLGDIGYIITYNGNTVQGSRKYLKNYWDACLQKLIK